jgi:hypothetical protein
VFHKGSYTTSTAARWRATSGASRKRALLGPLRGAFTLSRVVPGTGCNARSSGHQAAAVTDGGAGTLSTGHGWTSWKARELLTGTTSQSALFPLVSLEKSTHVSAG